MIKFLTLLKEKMMETMSKKHIKKLKPQKDHAPKFGVANGGHGCTPLGTDVMAPNAN